jgi:transcription antitermination factor NusG
MNSYNLIESRITPALSVSEQSWYAIQTMPRHEKRVWTELLAKEIHCYLPTTSEVRQWSDRKKVIVGPLFPGYVFVRLPGESPARISLLRTNGVVGFVGARRAGVPIPDAEIKSIQAVLESNLSVREQPFLNVGQRVRIRGGALEGVEGILQDIKGDQSLVISIELIQRSLAVTVSGFHVEPVSESGVPNLVFGLSQV